MTHSPSSAQSDLAPCPFCGGNAHIETRDVEPQGDSWYGSKTETFVLCDCGACLFDGSFHEGFYDPETRAVAAWNKRMAPSFPYQKTFNAIAAATKIEGSGHISISVKAFVEAFGEVEGRAAASAHTIGEDAANVAIGEREMSLRVALDFADNPRPYPSLAAPADTNGELYRALKILASAYRAALTAEKVAAEPIYQVLDPIEGGWSDGPRSLYDATDGAFRRIVYAAPQQPAQPVAQTQAPAGWFVQRSKFGPWVEVEQHEPGAEQFYRIAAQPVSGGKS